MIPSKRLFHRRKLLNKINLSSDAQASAPRIPSKDPMMSTSGHPTCEKEYVQFLTCLDTKDDCTNEFLALMKCLHESRWKEEEKTPTWKRYLRSYEPNSIFHKRWTINFISFAQKSGVEYTLRQNLIARICTPKQKAPTWMQCHCTCPVFVAEQRICLCVNCIVPWPYLLFVALFCDGCDRARKQIAEERKVPCSTWFKLLTPTFDRLASCW